MAWFARYVTQDIGNLSCPVNGVICLPAMTADDTEYRDPLDTESRLFVDPD